jgi:hypothetical protein
MTDPATRGTGPIDAVVTWVDGQDPTHRAKLEAYLAALGRRPAAAAPTRFRSLGEIDWCVSSLLRHAPFLRRIHIVTDAQVPPIVARAQHWPAPLREKLAVVDHREVFAGHADVLPSFNSLSIETVLYRIPGLAERFVYLNDDFMLIRPVQPEVWFQDDRPVLRGHFKPMPGRRPVDRLLALLRRVLGPGTPRASYTTAQVLAARLAGFDDRFLSLEHQPHPMLRSMQQAFFERHPQALRDNIVPRLRDASQFLPQGLGAHLALAAGQAQLSAEARLLYLKPGSASPARLRRQIAQADADGQTLFTCVQSLDQAPPAAYDVVAQALDRWIPSLDHAQ